VVPGFLETWRGALGAVKVVYGTYMFPRHTKATDILESSVDIELLSVEFRTRRQIASEAQAKTVRSSCEIARDYREITVRSTATRGYRADMRIYYPTITTT
jgi:hypothetical protein